MIEWLLFSVIAAAALIGGVMVIRTRDLVHAVLWLAVALVSTAGLYITLDAGFLAAIQILLYTGGIITLMLFAVLLARRTGGAIPAGESAGGLRAGLASLGLFAAVILTLVGGGAFNGPLLTLTTQELGATLLGPLVLPFEVVSVLLLAAMIGAIVLARRKDA